MLKTCSLWMLDCYQRWISPLLGQNCRYYPSCSEYSKLVFLHTNPLLAGVKTLVRLLCCNQLFSGGIAHPELRLSLKLVAYNKNFKVNYWLIPNIKKPINMAQMRPKIRQKFKIIKGFPCLTK